MRARRIAAGFAVAGAVLAGCRAPGIESEDLPQAPIAFIRQPASAGRISLAELRDALAAEPGGVETPRRALSAQLVLLTPSTGAISRIPGASPGDRPLDWSGDGARLLVGRASPGIRRLELHAWDRPTGAWSRPTLELASSGAAWADGPIRVAWGAIRSAPGEPWVRTIRVLQGTEGPRDLPSAIGGSDPDLASDGRRVVFARPGSLAGEDGLILLATPAAEEPRVLARGASPRFSRDGRWIVFTRGPVGARDIWLMRSDGRARRALTDSALHDEEHPCLSPDGAWVVYASARGARGESQLYAARLADRRERQLTLSGQNVWPVW